MNLCWEVKTQNMSLTLGISYSSTVYTSIDLVYIQANGGFSFIYIICRFSLSHTASTFKTHPLSCQCSSEPTSNKVSPTTRSNPYANALDNDIFLSGKIMNCYILTDLDQIALHFRTISSSTIHA